MSYDHQQLSEFIRRMVNEYVDQGPERLDFETRMLQISEEMAISSVSEEYKKDLLFLIKKELCKAEMRFNMLRWHWDKFIEVEPKIQSQILELMNSENYEKLFLDYLQIYSDPDQCKQEIEEGMEDISLNLLFIFRKEALIRLLRKEGLDRFCTRLANFSPVSC